MLTDARMCCYAGLMNKKQTAEYISRDEAKKRAALAASVIPGATVRHRSSSITVIASTGKHLMFWNGSKLGFTLLTNGR